MKATLFLRRGLPAFLVVATLLIGRAASVNAQDNEALPLVPIIMSDSETIVSGPLPEAESVNVGVANVVPDVPVVEHYPVSATEPAPQQPPVYAPPPPPASGLSGIILGDIEEVGRDVRNALGIGEPVNQPYVPPPGATIIPPGPICTRNGVLGPC